MLVPPLEPQPSSITRAGIQRPQIANKRSRSLTGCGCERDIEVMKNHRLRSRQCAFRSLRCQPFALLAALRGNNEGIEVEWMTLSQVCATPRTRSLMMSTESLLSRRFQSITLPNVNLSLTHKIRRQVATPPNSISGMAATPLSSATTCADSHRPCARSQVDYSLSAHPAGRYREIPDSRPDG